MPNASFFRSLGLFAQENFLAPEFCAELRAQMSQSKSRAAVIFGEEPSAIVEESIRKASSVDVERPAESMVRDHLLKVMPALENHFKVSLGDFQGPDYLKYDVGAFYLAHQDGSSTSHARAAKRRVSAVIFLNAQSKEPAENKYCGGSLTFYGLMDGPEWEDLPFPLEAETGLLIAFRPDVIHEVRPVTFGERFTIVSWYTAKE